MFFNCFKDKNNKNRIEKQKTQRGMSQIPIRRRNLVHIFSLTSYLIPLALASLVLIENFILFLFETLSLREEKEKVIEYIYFCDKKFNFSVNKFYLTKKKKFN